MSLHWIALNSVKGLGPVRIQQLLTAFGSPEKVFSASESELQNYIPQSCIGQLTSEKLFTYAQDQLTRAKELNVTILTLTDPAYPAYLREIFAPPPVLYIKGDVSVFSKHAIAIVGTRSPTVYGKTATVQIASELAERGFVITSGLARGIDTVAHESCLERNGVTIAVLGHGIDMIYPSQNKDLAKRIIEKGALVSEFPIGITPETFNFPRRNRIISGLSAGVLVVEAGEKSGSLITAHYAVQQNRDLFSVPGPINSPMSSGTFNLIKQGAVPVRCGNDIIESIQVINSAQVMDLATSAPSPKLPLELLGEEERTLYTALSSVPLRIDDIAETTGRSTSELCNLLLILELKGLVRQLSGSQFVRV